MFPENKQKPRASAAAAFILFIIAATARAQESRPVDAFGDPLPAGAVARYGTVRLRHSGPVSNLQLSPDESRLASASGDRTLRIWDASTGRELLRIAGHAGSVLCCAWSPDGTKIATGGADKSIRIWNASTGAELLRFEGHTWPVDTVAFAPDGKTLASAGGDKTIRIWNASTGEELQKFEGSLQAVASVAYSPDGLRLASGGGDRMVRIWNIKSGRIEGEFAGHEHMVYSVAFSKDGSFIYSGGGDKTVRAWNVKDGSSGRTHSTHSGIIFSLSVARDDGAVVTGGADGRVVWWNPQSSAVVHQFDFPSFIINSVVVTRDGKFAFVGGPAGAIMRIGGDVNVMEFSSGHVGPVRGLALIAGASGSQQLATAGTDGMIKIWDSAGARGSGIEFHEKPFASLVACDESGCIYFGTGDGLVGNVNIHNRQLENNFRSGAETKALAIHPASNLLAAGNQSGELILARLDTNEVIATIPAHKSGIASIAFSTEGALLATGSYDRTCKVWNVNERKVIFEWPAPPATQPASRSIAQGGMVHAVAFTGDGESLIVAGGDKAVHFYNIKSHAETGRLEGHAKPLYCIALSPDGRTLAAAGEEKIIYIWSTSDGRILTKLAGHEGSIYKLLFRPDGARLFSASEDTTVLEWDVSAIR
ncbi:MAG: WD40 repeat domain-containing protein [Planctomycetes bacterium]|nr:WD40 repeat domain-containing protein [Planctomycetota bacterium]